jgi:hypothetical protein
MKLKVTGLKKEMSTTGTGASFAAGSGEQYASPKAFKIRKDEIGEPFEIPILQFLTESLNLSTTNSYLKTRLMSL